MYADGTWKEWPKSPAFFLHVIVSIQILFWLLDFFSFYTETKTRKVEHGEMLSLFFSRVTFQVLVCT